MGDRKLQKEKRRNEIIVAGLHLFTRKGYAATKISDIAKEAGMSTGLMFHYFESKEKLYEELIKLGISGPMSVMSMEVDKPITFFEEAAKQILGYIVKDQMIADMFVLMSQSFYNEAAPESVKELLAGFDMFAPTEELIKKGQEDGTIREGNPRALAVTFWCAIQGVAEEIAIHPETPCPESTWIVDIIRRK